MDAHARSRRDFIAEMDSLHPELQHQLRFVRQSAQACREAPQVVTRAVPEVAQRYITEKERDRDASITIALEDGAHDSLVVMALLDGDPMLEAHEARVLVRRARRDDWLNLSWIATRKRVRGWMHAGTPRRR